MGCGAGLASPDCDALPVYAANRLILSVYRKDCILLSTINPSFPRKRESKPQPAQMDEWFPAFAGMTGEESLNNRNSNPGKLYLKYSYFGYKY
jgi:hypothetical protein